MQLERKDFTFNPSKIEVKADDSSIGIIEGYASTWETDQGNDRILQGAFSETIQDYVDEGKSVPAKYMHEPLEIIGGLPAASMREDEKGLWVSMHVNLDVERGKEAYALAKQNVLKRFSIGYYAANVRYEDGVRIIPTIKLVEISLVDHSMNLGAVVTGVKGFTPYRDLPLADADYKFDMEGAIKRVREFTGSIESPTKAYSEAFFYNYGYSQSDLSPYFDDYVLMFADVVDGERKAVKQAVESAYYSVSGMGGGVWLPREDIGFVKDCINRYLSRFNSALSFDTKAQDITKFNTDCVATWRERELEAFLKSSGFLNKKDAKGVISNIKKSIREELELKKSMENLLIQMKKD